MTRTHHPIAALLLSSAIAVAPPVFANGQKRAPAVTQNHGPAASHPAGHWGYEGTEGPAYWGMLSPEFGMCATGKDQSPVDLGGANVSATIAVAANYQRGPLVTLNNGHTVQANFPSGSYLLSGARRFDLVQVHFHTPSENVVNKRVYPLEAHFVHKDAQGRLAVLGVFFEEGATNIELAKLIVAAPRQKGGPTEIEGFNFNPAALLPEKLEVYRFMGSLTTPPCTEGVHWHVARQSVQASATQIASLKAIMGLNARPVQPLGGRLLIAPE